MTFCFAVLSKPFPQLVQIGVDVSYKSIMDYSTLMSPLYHTILAHSFHKPPRDYLLYDVLLIQRNIAELFICDKKKQKVLN